MQGSIAQIVALTVHGNAILQNSSAFDSAEFQRRNSTFKFCESVNFVERPSDILNRKEGLYAANPHDWFERLKTKGVRGLQMSYGPSGQQKVPDRTLVGFVGGGGKWLVEARRSGSLEFWESRWELGDQDRADKKIWRVSYLHARGRKLMTQKQSEDLRQLRLELRQCLERISQFSRSRDLEWFTKAFESGIARLESPDPLAGVYHSDIAPPGFLSLAASQLLGSAQAAWVFGGMGSWNDQGFKGGAQALYEQLSEDLYQLLNRAVVAAANSSSPD